MDENSIKPVIQLLVVITDRDNTKKLAELFRNNKVHIHYMFNAVGSASSEVLDFLGLSSTEKVVALCLEPKFRMSGVMESITNALNFDKPGKGISFSIPISCISSSIARTFSEELQQIKEVWEERMEREVEKIKENADHDLIVAMVNHGYSDNVMDAAKEAGARGGTIIHARRVALDETVKFFGISLNAEKELVIIFTDRKNRKNIMQEISKACGMNTEAKGMVFSLPVDDFSGIALD